MEKPPPPPPQAQPRQTSVSPGAQGSISGHVFRADTGKPLAGVIVTLDFADSPKLGRSAGPLAAVRTDANGAYKFTSVDPDSYRISPQSDVFGIFLDVPPTVLALGQVIENLNFFLRPTGTISGSVHDDHGDPVSGIIVVALAHRLGAHDAEVFSFAWAMTDDSGTYRVTGAPAGHDYVELQAKPPCMCSAEEKVPEHAVFYPNSVTLADARVVPVKFDKETPNIEFRVSFTPDNVIVPAVSAPPPVQPTSSNSATGSISGHVYRIDTGVPLPGAIVRLSCCVSSQPGPHPPTATQIARTDAGGAYRISGVVPGVHTLQVECAGCSTVLYGSLEEFKTSPQRIGQITFTAGQARNNVDFRLQPSGNAAMAGVVGSISGTVRGDGELLADYLEVMALRPSEEGEDLEIAGAGSAGVDERGKFRLANLPAGDYYVFLTFARPTMRLLGYHSLLYPSASRVKDAQLVHVKPGEDTANIRFTLRSAPTFTVTVKVIGGSEDDLVRIGAFDAEPALANLVPDELPSILTGADGVARQRGIRAGTYSIQVEYSGVPEQGAGTDSSGLTGSAIINVTNADVTVEIPFSTFRDAQ